MKALIVVYFSLVILAFSACQKSNQEASVPGVTTDCLNNPNLCNSGLYQQSPGFYPYNYGGSNQGSYYGSGYNPFLYGSGSLCSCPMGTMPTYNNYAGLGCVQNTLISGYAYLSFGYASNNNQWTHNLPQVSNISGYTGYSSQSCYNSVVQSCFVGSANNCSAGYTCRINSASATLGVCISNTTGLRY